MKIRISKKLMKKFNDGRCERCGKLVKARFHYSEMDERLGLIEFDGMHSKCHHCGLTHVFSALWSKKEAAEMQKVEKLLCIKYPIASNEYLTIEEIEKLQGKKLSDEAVRHLNYFVYNMVVDGRRLYLKKAYDRAEEMKYQDPRFSLVD